MKRIILLAVSLIFVISASAQKNLSHPYLVVNNADKPAVLEKIKTQQWAKESYEQILENVAPYVERHKKDPNWILGRYRMNWEEGKHYTDFYAARAHQPMDSMRGNAVVPTVRVAERDRTPANDKGNSYRLPPLEDIVPYDVSPRMLLINPDTGEKEMREPWGLLEGVNRQINQLALESAVIYWLTGKEEYAKFAADILDQFARGAYHQNPIHGNKSFGFIGQQTLNDATYQPLMLVYDFLQPYMKRKRYEMKYYQNVWEKFAITTLVNGYWNNNWYAAESCTLMYSAMLLEDQKKRDFFIEHFMDKDTIDGGWGHLSLRSTMEKWLTPDGHWKEPGGYHTFPVSNLLRASLTMEKNGIKVFDKYPALFDAASVAMKYVYPNIHISSFGDSGRGVPSSELVEIGLVFAQQYRPEAMPELLAAAKVLTDNGYMNRGRTGVFGLLTYVPEINLAQAGTYEWPRSGKFDFAQFYLQRNGMNKDRGLMYSIQGATYNHNHNNGMAMELYGVGDVQAIDPGTGPYYEHELHQTYFAQWGSHNTVVVGGSSTSVPHSGGAGTKRIGQLEVHAMEPYSEQPAISPYVSFTDTRFEDKSTETKQQRIMALIRTSDKTGYYVDIFRSDNKERNDYMYHNIGDKVELFSRTGQSIPVQDAEIELVGNDYPGLRHISNVKATGKYLDDVVAIFTLNEGNPAGVRHMKGYFPYNIDRNYYIGYSPRAKTAGSYSPKPIPTLMVQSMSDTWGTPFVAIFEPYFAKDGSSVTGVTKLTRGNENEYVTLLVDNKDGSQQYIFQGTNANQREQTGHGFAFKGYFGVASLKNGQPQYIYLGQGKKLTVGDFTIEGQNDNCAVNIEFLPGGMKVTSNQSVKITAKNSGMNSASLNNQTLPFTKDGTTVTFTVPAVKDGIIK